MTNTKTKKEMEETTELEKLKQTWTNAQKSLAKLESEMSILETKREERSWQLVDNDKMLTAADEEKRAAVKSLALGRITEERYAAMKKNHGQVLQDKVDIGYMLEALDEEIELIGQKIASQRPVIQEAEKAYWASVSNCLMAQAQEHAALLGKTYLAYRMAFFGSKDFGEFVEECIFPGLRHCNSNNDVYSKLQSELIADYVGK